ncbi:NUDIX hydrolase [Noviherbaspirillum galbum]|uniref:NUDIX hydrolase n=1 Tax=Noviherbaspirillum galbum TaxID=2709383 RepID=A0A6B3SRN2_9BURK|nr:NUDIX hydrolase [Noviherbaspirillum galbum]NEX61092.1 NUDIX hydrolase [Noviherbaspirillum galbum]
MRPVVFFDAVFIAEEPVASIFEGVSMPALAKTYLQAEVATTCGTLIVNKSGQLLLCHVTGTNHWDIPKGLREYGESTLEAAKRELREETGLQFEDAMFEEIGDFEYVKNKRLYLYKAQAPDSMDSLGNLICTSYFSHRVTGDPTPEMDSFRWASRGSIETLCPLPMARRLLSLEW